MLNDDKICKTVNLDLMFTFGDRLMHLEKSHFKHLFDL